MIISSKKYIIRILIITVFFVSIFAFTNSYVFANALEDEILIRYNTNIENSEQSVSEIHTKNGFKVKSKNNLVKGLQTIKLNGKISREKAIEIYKKNPNILYAEPNYSISSVANEKYVDYKFLKNKKLEEKKYNVGLEKEITSSVTKLESIENNFFSDYYENEPNDLFKDSNSISEAMKNTDSVMLRGMINDIYDDIDFYKFEIDSSRFLKSIGYWNGAYFGKGFEEDLTIALLDDNGNILNFGYVLGSNEEMFQYMNFELIAGNYYLLVFQSGTDEEKYIDIPYTVELFYDEVKDTNVPSFTNLWGFENIGQQILSEVGISGADISGTEAWGIETGSENTKIAVIDSGIDGNHFELSNNMWRDPNGYFGVDFTNQTYNPIDENGHGTHIAGSIAASKYNDSSINGLMWSADLMDLKVLNSDGNGSISDLINAVEYANFNGANVINLSLGSVEYSYALRDVLMASDAVIVAAAGNSGSNNDYSPLYPANYDLPHLISVAATNNRDELMSFSNYGYNTVDVASPGHNIYSTAIGGNYEYMSGTSMAASYVTGLAGLILSKAPDLSKNEVVNLIKLNVDYLESLQGKIKTEGRINAFKTLSQLKTATSIDNIELKEEKIELINGGEIQLEAIVTSSDASNEDLIWESSNPDIVSVNNKGFVKALNSGNSTIRVYSTESYLEDTCEIIVREPKFKMIISKVGDGETNIEPGEYIFLKGEIFTLEAIPSKGYIFDKWVIDNDEFILNSSIDIEMTDDVSIVAHFIEEGLENEWNIFPMPENKVSINKKWKISFNRVFNLDEIDGVVIEHNNNFIPVMTTPLLDDKQLIIEPTEPYQLNSDYSLRIFLSNSKRYKMDFKTIE